MTPLKSTAIISSDYDLANKTLKVTFQSGDTYSYNGVPPEVAQGLNRAESAGKFFHTSIRPHYVGAKQKEEA